MSQYATIQQVNSSIMFGDFTNDQLESIVMAIKFRRTELTQKNKRSLRVGDNVNFTNNRTGRNMTGAVTKVAVKYITVRTIDGLWRVPANMLTKVNEIA